MSAEIGDERLDDVGLNPPAVRSIPIWIGGKEPAAVRRAVAYGSGLILAGFDGAEADDAFRDVRTRLDAAADAAGRPRDELGIEVWHHTKEGDQETWRAAREHSSELGATHVSFQTYAAEPISPAQHIERLGLVAGAVIA